MSLEEPMKNPRSLAMSSELLLSGVKTISGRPTSMNIRDNTNALEEALSPLILVFTGSAFCPASPEDFRKLINRSVSFRAAPIIYPLLLSNLNFS